MELKSTSFTSAEQTHAAEYYVLGGGPLGVSIARRLEAEGHTVRLIDDARDPDEVSGIQADPTDVGALEADGIADASAVVVATDEDSRNLLVAQNLRARFDIPDIFVLVHVPDRCELFEEVGHEPVCATTVLSEALLDQVSVASSRPEATE
jgi:trk system potassium uptake protein TrkA